MKTLKLQSWGISLFLFLFFCCQAQAQSSGNFSLPHNGEEITVTQDINTAFLGWYNSKMEGYQLSQAPGESIFTNIATGKKVEIIWGLLLNNEEPVKTRVTEYRRGKTVSYDALVIIVYNTEENSSEEILMYELDGKRYFGQCEKIEAVAENR